MMIAFHSYNIKDGDKLHEEQENSKKLQVVVSEFMCFDIVCMDSLYMNMKHFFPFFSLQSLHYYY
jgi:hypothetical protein